MIVESQKRKKSELQKLSEKIAKEKKEAEKKLKELKKQEFACEVDALRAAKKLLKKSKYHQLTDIHTSVLILKSKDHPKCYQKIEATVSPCPEKINPIKKRAGRFILATNVWNTKTLSSEKMLGTYKQDQQSVSRGFRFLRIPDVFYG